MPPRAARRARRHGEEHGAELARRRSRPPSPGALRRRGRAACGAGSWRSSRAGLQGRIVRQGGAVGQPWPPPGAVTAGATAPAFPRSCRASWSSTAPPPGGAGGPRPPGPAGRPAGGGAGRRHPGRGAARLRLGRPRPGAPAVRRLRFAAYFAARGRPEAPADLASHDCLDFSQSSGRGVWRLGAPSSRAGKGRRSRPAGSGLRLPDRHGPRQPFAAPGPSARTLSAAGGRGRP
jgi:hypothetical protein